MGLKALVIKVYTAVSPHTSLQFRRHLLYIFAAAHPAIAASSILRFRRVLSYIFAGSAGRTREISSSPATSPWQRWPSTPSAGRGRDSLGEACEQAVGGIPYRDPGSDAADPQPMSRGSVKRARRDSNPQPSDP